MKTIGDLEYEIDGEKLNGGGLVNYQSAIKNSIPFSKTLGLSVSPIVALKRTMKIKPGEKVILNLINISIKIKKKLEEKYKKYINQENIKKEHLNYQK